LSPSLGKYQQNEELRDLYVSPNIIRIIKSGTIGWVEHMARRGRREMNAGLCWGKEGNRPLGRPKRREDDNIKADLKENRVAGRGPDFSGFG
jgi:hypothetical protein